MATCDLADMGPACLNVRNVRAGDKNEMPVEILYGQDPWDLTGATVTAHVKADKTDPSPALVAQCTVTDAALGLVTVVFDGDEVRTLLAGAETWQGVWDMQVLQSGDLQPTTACEGTWHAVLDVTAT